MTSPERTGFAARGSTLLVTNVTKLTGVALAINEAVLRANARDSVIALCALFVLGAQVAENSLLRLIDRMFGPQNGNGNGKDVAEKTG